MSNGYFILENGEQSGPFTLKELTERDIENHSKILVPDSEEWQDACDLPELYPYFESIGVYLPTGDNLASFWMRLLAFAFDYVFISIILTYEFSLFPYFGIQFKMPTMEELTKMPKADYYHVLIVTAITFDITVILYNAICEASPLKGSFGKRLLRLVVVDVEGYNQNFFKALLRGVGKVFSLSFWGIGFLPIFFSEHKQAAHDLLVKTYVVRKNIW